MRTDHYLEMLAQNIVSENQLRKHVKKWRSFLAGGQCGLEPLHLDMEILCRCMGALAWQPERPNFEIIEKNISKGCSRESKK